MGMMTNEELRMRHKHNAMLQRIGTALEGLTGAISNAVKSAQSDIVEGKPLNLSKAYVVCKEFCDGCSTDVSHLCVYLSRENAEIAVRNAFVFFEGDGGFGKGEQLRIIEESPWRIHVDNGMGGDLSAEFYLDEVEVRA